MFGSLVGKLPYPVERNLRLMKSKIVRFIKQGKNNRKYRNDMKLYSRLNTHENFKIDKKYSYKITSEWDQQAGHLGEYVWQDFWGAHKVFENRPEVHYDIGSTVGRFIMHLTSFDQKVCLIDVRPLDVPIPNVSFVQGDAKDLSSIPDGSIESLSSLCAFEHFGLGRYGDDIDPDGCFKAFKEVQRVMKTGGYFYLSVPIGKERVEFNAHRIFYPRTIVNLMDQMELLEFSTTGSTDAVIYNDDLDRFNDVDTHGWVFGLFVFKKL